MTSRFVYTCDACGNTSDEPRFASVTVAATGPQFVTATDGLPRHACAPPCLAKVLHMLAATAESAPSPARRSK